MKDIGVKIVAVSIGDEIKENYMMDYATHSSLHVMIEDFDNAVNSIDTLQDLICQSRRNIILMEIKWVRIEKFDRSVWIMAWHCKTNAYKGNGST